MIGHASLVPVQRTSGELVARTVPGSAVERYKEIARQVDQSLDRMREHDRERVRLMVGWLIASQERMAEVIGQERVTRGLARVHWEAVVELLWEERWMKITPMPAPDESVPPRPQREYDEAMDRAYRALEEAAQKRSLLRRKSA
ncbi:hypothetical protein Q5530_25230 [Saccharothrix sp. BKS2]|uniref:hypothetical protein n=1 Tax=Saccharothrix sp. BKS2 TaxID=3064400 RepID=UPI0039EBD477